MSILTSSQSLSVMFNGRFAQRRSSLGSIAIRVALTTALILAAKPLHSQNDALSIDDKGNVGIGTKTPKAPLEVNGDAKVSKDLTIGSLLTVGSGIDAQTPAPTEDGQRVMSKITAIKLFQGAGVLQLQYVKTKAATAEIHRIGFADNLGNWISWSEYSTNNSYIPGNLGIGIEPTDPAVARLAVNGNIKLGPKADMYASASSENLRMLRGNVDKDGNPTAGKGFKVDRKEDGKYQITFDDAFSDLPSATATQLAVSETANTLDNAVIDSLSKTGMIVYVGSSNGTKARRAFSFIVMGPR
jgi:hypothetical protein